MGSFSAARRIDRGPAELGDDQILLHIGRRIRVRRRLLGLSQEHVALQCGVRFQQIQKYESGMNTISAARLWRLSQSLGVPMNYFFDGLG